MPGYEPLVAVGVCLIVLGLVLRGIATAIKRRLANERQHQRLTGERSAEARPLTHFERHAGRYARIAISLGVAITLVGFFRR
jgi:hypothetical protein